MKAKHFGFIILGLTLTIIYFVFDPMQHFFPKCPLYTTTGIYCPGCGSQRAFHSLIHFNFKNVFQQNILFLTGIIFSVYYLIVSILNTYFGKKINNFLNHKKAPIWILIVVILFWILRNIPIYPFTLLAPK